MRNIIFFVMMVCLFSILSSCQNHSEVTINKPLEQNNDDKLLIQKDKEKKDTVWLKEKSLFQVTAVDGDKSYTVFLFAEDEKITTLEESNSLGNAGEILYEGKYQVYLAEKDSTVAYKQEISLGENLTFNAAKKNMYTFQMGSKTLLAILQTVNASEGSVSLLAIKNGEVVLVNADKELLIYGNQLKAIGQFYLQTVQYVPQEDSQNYNWKFTTYSFDQDQLAISLLDETTFTDTTHRSGMNEGQYWYEKWKEKDETFFPFHNLTIESGILSRAKLGVLQGSQYPIGTNIDEITKSNPSYIEEGKDENGLYITYSEVTYYVDEDSHDVQGILIPGQRFKITIDQAKEQIDTPPAEEGIDELKNETYAYYAADKYILELRADATGQVSTIYLRKK